MIIQVILALVLDITFDMDFYLAIILKSLCILKDIMKQISIIVPIYNVAPYLKECLNSLIAQTYRHLEIILVDDGSTDTSLEIAKQYLSDRRIKLICKENGGLSSARNAGMREASGDFIAFIDSDDYLCTTYLEEMLKVLELHAVDFVCNQNIVRFSSNKSSQPSQKTPPIIHKPNTSNIVFGGAVWRFLFSMDFLKNTNVEFLEGKIYEDEAFLYMIAPLSSQFAIFHGAPYFYRQRKDSIMAQHANFRSYDLLDVFEAIFLFYQKHHLLEDFRPPYYFLYNSGIGYSNEMRYLIKAQKLSKSLALDQYPLPKEMQELIKKNFLPLILREKTRIFCAKYKLLLKAIIKKALHLIKKILFNKM